MDDHAVEAGGDAGRASERSPAEELDALLSVPVGGRQDADGMPGLAQAGHLGRGIGGDAVGPRREGRDDQDPHSGSTWTSTGMNTAPVFSSPRETSKKNRFSSEW